MDLALHASLVTFTRAARGGTFEEAWQKVDAVVAEHGAPGNADDLRRVMAALDVSRDEALAMVGG